MSQNKKLFFIMLLTAVLSSCLTYFLARPAPQINIASEKQSFQINQQHEQAIAQVYTQNMDKLQKQNDSLLKVIHVHKAALMLSNQKVLQLEDKVTALASTVKKEPDTLKEKIAQCDTLGTDATILVSQEVKRDSMCEVEVSDLNVLVQEKDTALADCQNSYVNMRQVADSSLQQQQQALTQIQDLNKQLKRKTAQSRLLSAGILILTGVTATLYLSHR